MKLSLSCIFLIIATTLVAAEKSRFDNYRVYRINIENEQQLQIFRQLEETSDSYTFWQSANKVKSTLDLVVPPHQFSHFSEIVEKLNLKTMLMIENLQKAIDDESPMKQGKAAEDMSWTSYQSTAVIHEWMEELGQKYPEFVTVSNIGASYQDRDIKLLKLSKKAGNRAIFVEGNMHAREWISSATVTWLMNELLTSNDENIKDLAENIDWYFIPVSNPDGYEFTRTNNRQWRKTRSVHSLLCFGADPNRNFYHNWFYQNTGASSNPCSDTFAGPNPFSESEALAIENFLKANPGKFDAYLSFHSYAQVILYPYGHTKTKVPNAAELQQIGDAAAAKLKLRYQTSYDVGNTVELLYVATGVSVDHAYGNHSIPIAYTYEMRDTGRYGFVLPPEQIIPNAQEVMDSLVALVAEARVLSYF